MIFFREFRVDLTLARGKPCTMLLHILSLKSPAIRIVSGACLQTLEAEIRREAMNKLSQIRFNGDGYIFGGTWDGVSTIGPVVGRKMWDVTDVNGVKIVQEMVRVARNGGGFVEYAMPELDGMRNARKLSYALPIPEWQWYIGAGVYLDDIDDLIVANQEQMGRTVLYQAGVVVTALLLVGFVAYLLSRRLTGRIRRDLEQFADAWNKMATGDFALDEKKIHYKEFRQLAVTAKKVAEERRVAREQLIENKQRFETLVANVPGIVYERLMDESGTLLYINDNIYELTGYPAADFLGSKVQTLDFLIDPRDQEWVERAKKEGALGRRPFSVEYRIIRADGQLRWFMEQCQIRHANDGTPLSIAGVITDITQKRESEEEHYAHMHFLETMERVDRQLRRGATMDTILDDAMGTVRKALACDRAWLVFPCDPSVDFVSIPVQNAAPEFKGNTLQSLSMEADSTFKRVMQDALNSPGPVTYDWSGENIIPPEVRKSIRYARRWWRQSIPVPGNPGSWACIIAARTMCGQRVSSDCLRKYPAASLIH